MSLHLGSDFSISSSHIVCILNLLKTQRVGNSPETLTPLEKVRKIGSPPYRSAILGIKGTVFLTTFTANTITGRIRKDRTLFQRLEGKYGQKPEA
jgi:hypothetical protein